MVFGLHGGSLRDEVSGEPGSLHLGVEPGGPYKPEHYRY